MDNTASPSYVTVKNGQISMSFLIDSKKACLITSMLGICMEYGGWQALNFWMTKLYGRSYKPHRLALANPIHNGSTGKPNSCHKHFTWSITGPYPPNLKNTSQLQSENCTSLSCAILGLTSALSFHYYFFSLFWFSLRLSTRFIIIIFNIKQEVTAGPTQSAAIAKLH